MQAAVCSCCGMAVTDQSELAGSPAPVSLSLVPQTLWSILYELSIRRTRMPDSAQCFKFRLRPKEWVVTFKCICHNDCVPLNSVWWLVTECNLVLCRFRKVVLFWFAFFPPSSVQQPQRFSKPILILHPFYLTPSLWSFFLSRHCKILLSFFWKDLQACVMPNWSNKRNSFQVSLIVVNLAASRTFEIQYPHLITPSN